MRRLSSLILLWIFNACKTNFFCLPGAIQTESQMPILRWCHLLPSNKDRREGGTKQLLPGLKMQLNPIGQIEIFMEETTQGFLGFFLLRFDVFFYIYLVSVGSKAFKESFVTGITVSSNNIPFTNLLSLLIVKVSAKRVTYLFSAFKWGHLNSTRANCLIATRNCLSNLWLFFLQKAKLSTLLTGAVAQKVDRNISGFTGVVGRSVDQNSTL